MKTTLKITVSAMLIAFDVVFTRLLAVNVLWVKLGFGFAAVALCAMLWGPAWAGLCAAIGDLVGSLLFPAGGYFPGFTVTAAITGVIYGLFLYRERPSFVRCFLAALSNTVLVTLILNSLMIILVFQPAAVGPLMAARAVEAGLSLAAQTAVIYAFSASDVLYDKIRALGSR